MLHLESLPKLKCCTQTPNIQLSKGSTYRMKLQILGLPYTDVCLLLGISIPRVRPYSCLSQNILIRSQPMLRSHTEAYSFIRCQHAVMQRHIHSYDANMLSCIGRMTTFAYTSHHVFMHDVYQQTVISTPGLRPCSHTCRIENNISGSQFPCPTCHLDHCSISALSPLTHTKSISQCQTRCPALIHKQLVLTVNCIPPFTDSLSFETLSSCPTCLSIYCSTTRLYQHWATQSPPLCSQFD